MRQHRLRRPVVVWLALAACCGVGLTISSLAAASRGGSPGPNDQPATANNSQAASGSNNAGGSDQGLANRSASADPAPAATSSSSSSSSSTSGNGANQSGPYNSTFDGSPSGNGNGGGAAVGRPCAGCVGKADNKNPPGQYPNGASDGNNGYECDGNHGVGRTNPAHTGCRGVTTTTPGGSTTQGRSSSQAGNPEQPNGAVAAVQQASAPPAHAPQRIPTPVAGRSPGPVVQLLGKRLPFTGLPVLLVALIGAVLVLGGVAGRTRLRQAINPRLAGSGVDMGPPPAPGAETGARTALAHDRVATTRATGSAGQVGQSLGERPPVGSTGLPVLLFGVIGALLALAVIVRTDHHA